MKKRLLSVLIAIFIILSLFVGCTQKNAQSSSVDSDSSVSVDPSPDLPSGNPSDEHKHTDVDSDEKCDGCQQSVVTIVDFYVLNDLHGKFCDTDSQIGVDEMATYLRQAKNSDDNVILLSTGDMWQGSGESNLTNGAILVEWMNQLGFVGMTLGNHEFDWGEEAILKNAQLAEFPFLAINIYDVDTGKLAEYCTPSVMVDCGDIQVGIIGAIGDCHSSISGDNNKGFTFKVGTELTNLVKEESIRLKNEGADLIAYALHDGHSRGNDNTQTIGSGAIKSYYDTALSDGYVDLVFEGHSHQKYVLIDEKGVYHIQGGGENYGVSHVEIKVNTINGQNKVTDASVIHSSKYKDLEDDAATEELEKKYAQSISYAYDVLGRADQTVSGDQLGDLMAQYYLDVALERWGDKYDIVLGGGYIKTRSPYDMDSGEKTYADILTLFPFDNRLVLCSVKGSKLLSQFIQTSNSNYHIALSEYGKSIIGKIDPNGTYYLITDSYSSTYAPNGLTEVAEYDSGVFARDLLANALKNGDFEVKHNDYTLTSIADLLEIGIYFGPNAESSDYYYVEGIVTSQPNTTYGNLDLADGDSSIFVYGLKDLSGNRYDAMSQKISVGDKVVIYGRLKRYVNSSTGEDKIEVIDGVVIDHTKKDEALDIPSDTDTPDESNLITVKEALTIGNALASGAQTDKEYCVSGKITKITNTTYGNMYIEDEQGNSIYIYGLYDANGLRFDAMPVKLNVGEKIKISGPILHYVNPNTGEKMIEFKNAVLIEKIK